MAADGSSGGATPALLWSPRGASTKKSVSFPPPQSARHPPRPSSLPGPPPPVGAIVGAAADVTAHV